MSTKISGHAGVGPGAHFSGPIWIKTALDTSAHLTGMTPYTFGVDAVVTSSTTALMVVCGGANTVTNYVAPFRGSIVAITGQTSANTAASSSITAAASIAGVVQTGTMSQTIGAAASQLSGTTTNLTSFVFAAGDALAISYASTSTDPAADIAVTLWTV